MAISKGYIKAAGLKAVLLASTVMTAAPAYAQIDEIIVTSQKRSESLQDVPISIQAFNTEKLEQLEVSAFADYAKFLPSLSFQSTGPNSTTVYFRGVVSGGDGNHSASLPSVGVYLDEQPVTTILGFLPVHIYDIERVEGIAGPQGTLYGASAQSGVLRIITNKPVLGESQAKFDLEGNFVEHGDFGYQFEGMVNHPVGENAAIRLVGYYKKDAGYIDNVPGGRIFPGTLQPGMTPILKDNLNLVEKDFNGIETYGARVALKVDLNENWTIMPTVLAQKSSATGTQFYNPESGDLKISRFVPEYNRDKFIQAAMTVEGKLGDFDLVVASSYLRRQLDSNTDYTDYGYYYDVLYQSYGPGYNFASYFYDDLGNNIDPSQFYTGDDSFGKFANEIRISSPQDRNFRFVAGFFQNRQSHDIRQQYYVNNLATVLEVTGQPDTIWLTQQKRIDRDLALFTEMEYDLTDRLTLIGGIRGYKYKNTLYGFFGYGAGYSTSQGEAICVPGLPALPDSPCTDLDKASKNTGETHKLSVTYDLDDSKMVYLTYSTGFRPGGVNRRPTLPPYLEDKLVNYEAGFKTQWADNTFILNGAVFYQKWKDFQFPILGLNGLTEIKNAAQAQIYGLEADMTWAPTSNFTLNGALSWIHAELSENYCGFTDVNGNPETVCPQAVDDPLTDGDETANPEAPDGTRLPVVPKFKGTLTARYEFPVGAARAHVQGSVSGQGAAPSNLLVADQAIIGNLDGYALVDFSVGLQGDDWRLVTYLSNAFDERPNQNAFVGCAISTCGITGPSGNNGIYYSTARPRTIGIRFGKDF